MANAVGVNLRTGAAVKKTVIPTRFISAPGDMGNVLGKVSLKDSVKICTGTTLPKEYLAYKTAKSKIIRNTLIAQGAGLMMFAASIYFPPAAPYLIPAGTALLSGGQGFLYFALRDNGNKLISDLKKLSPQDRKEAVAQISIIDPDLANRISEKHNIS